MYKAGDFTNGKMNEIFKKASNSAMVVKYDKGDHRHGVTITHKQFGEFILVNGELLAIKSAGLYCTITGMTINEFYEKFGDGSVEADERQLDAVNHLLSPCSDSDNERADWVDAYFMLSDRLMAITDQSDRAACIEYMEIITNVKQRKNCNKHS